MIHFWKHSAGEASFCPFLQFPPTVAASWSFCCYPTNGRSYAPSSCSCCQLELPPSCAPSSISPTRTRCCQFLLPPHKCTRSWWNQISLQIRFEILLRFSGFNNGFNPGEGERPEYQGWILTIWDSGQAACHKPPQYQIGVSLSSLWPIPEICNIFFGMKMIPCFGFGNCGFIDNLVYFPMSFLQLKGTFTSECELIY